MAPITEARITRGSAFAQTAFAFGLAICFAVSVLFEVCTDDSVPEDSASADIQVFQLDIGREEFREVDSEATSL